MVGALMAFNNTTCALLDFDVPFVKTVHHHPQVPQVIFTVDLSQDFCKSLHSCLSRCLLDQYFPLWKESSLSTGL